MPDTNGDEVPAAMELVRLAIPRRAYTQSHMDYVVEAVLRVWEQRDGLRGFRIAEQAPVLRHFTGRIEKLRVGPRRTAPNGPARNSRELPDLSCVGH